MVVLDDLLIETYLMVVCDFFNKGTHHRNISVIHNTQNLFHEGRLCRDLLMPIPSCIYERARQELVFKPRQTGLS